jgi:hypothetical protein
MNLNTMARVLAASLFIVGCAPRAPETIVVNPSEISFPKTYSVILNERVVPPGGIVDRTASGWTVHGTMDGVAWRYGSDEHFLLIATRPGVVWPDLDNTKDWPLSCAFADNSDLQCSFSQLGYVGDTVRGLTVGDMGVCVSGGGRFLDSGDLIIGDGEVHRAPQHPACFPPEEGAMVLKSLLGAQSFMVKSPQAGGETTFSTYGLKQALTLKDWIRERYAAGDLDTKEGL